LDYITVIELIANMKNRLERLSMGDDFGDRMKEYESVETDRIFLKDLPIYARLDGRSFSKFTRNMDRPFDSRMSQCMIETTRYIVDKTHASVGYTSSDEISIAWPAVKTSEGQHFFAGKIQKICSVLAGMAAAKFAYEYTKNFGVISDSMPHFDCRVINMPNQIETVNMFLWRALDAEKNAIGMIARHHFSHSILQNKSILDMLELLKNKNVDINSYPNNFKYGVWLKRVIEEQSLTDDKILRIPEKHRSDQITKFLRSRVIELDVSRFSEIDDKINIIFGD